MANPELVEDGEELIVDLLVTSAYKYVGSGVGITAPLKANTALETPALPSRVIGTQSEGTTASIYKLVGLVSYTTTLAITECGVFDGAGAGNPPTGGILFIRGTFGAINVVSGDKIEFTITLEIL